MFLLPSVLWCCWLGGRKGIWPVKNWVVWCWRRYVIWHEVHLHMAQQMPLPLTISCSSKSRLVLPSWFLPFWYLLTRAVRDKFQKSSKMIVCRVREPLTLSGPCNSFNCSDHSKKTEHWLIDWWKKGELTMWSAAVHNQWAPMMLTAHPEILSGSKMPVAHPRFPVFHWQLATHTQAHTLFNNFEHHFSNSHSLKLGLVSLLTNKDASLIVRGILYTVQQLCAK